jgi:hypothetical protein
MEEFSIHNRIYEVRDCRVMIDFDLAVLYGVETKRLKEAVRRNLKRFPPDFMFELKPDEYDFLRTQIASLEKTGRGKFPKYLPFAFTEHGVTMMASILNSERAIQMNIAIVRAFVEIKKSVGFYKELKEQLRHVFAHLEKHDSQLEIILKVIEKLAIREANTIKWENRTRIGFDKR